MYPFLAMPLARLEADTLIPRTSIKRRKGNRLLAPPAAGLPREDTILTAWDIEIQCCMAGCVRPLLRIRVMR